MSTFEGMTDFNLQRRLLKPRPPIRDKHGSLWADWAFRSPWNPAQAAWNIHNAIARRLYRRTL